MPSMRLLTGLLICSLASSASIAQSPSPAKPLPTPPPVVQLDAGAGEPLETLAAGIKKYPKAPVLRVIWSSSALVEGAASYDRQRHTLKYHITDQIIELHGSFKQQATYAHVTDRIIMRAARVAKAQHGTSSEITSAFFETLPQYGCKRIQFTQKMP